MRHVSRAHRVNFDWFYERIKSLAKLTTNFILENKFDRDQTNHLLGPMKVQSASTRRRWTLSKRQVLLLPQDGNRLRDNVFSRYIAHR